MERLDGGSAVPAHLRGGIVALGNFDGFHAGHQAVVGRAVARARAEGRPALVATFDPHPMRFFRPESAWFRLTSLDQREALVKAAGADEMLVRSEEHTSELQSLMRISYAVFCLKKKTTSRQDTTNKINSNTTTNIHYNHAHTLHHINNINI